MVSSQQGEQKGQRKSEGRCSSAQNFKETARSSKPKLWERCPLITKGSSRASHLRGFPQPLHKGVACQDRSSHTRSQEEVQCSVTSPAKGEAGSWGSALPAQSKPVPAEQGSRRSRGSKLLSLPWAFLEQQDFSLTLPTHTCYEGYTSLYTSTPKHLALQE